MQKSDYPSRGSEGTEASGKKRLAGHRNTCAGDQEVRTSGQRRGLTGGHSPGIRFSLEIWPGFSKIQNKQR